jgi:hypothetical protein
MSSSFLIGMSATLDRQTRFIAQVLAVPLYALCIGDMPMLLRRVWLTYSPEIFLAL